MLYYYITIRYIILHNGTEHYALHYIIMLIFISPLINN